MSSFKTNALKIIEKKMLLQMMNQKTNKMNLSHKNATATDLKGELHFDYFSLIACYFS